MPKKYKRKGFSKKQLKAIAREEAKTAKKYKSKGYLLQGSQEAQHAKFFAKEAKERGV